MRSVVPRRSGGKIVCLGRIDRSVASDTLHPDLHLHRDEARRGSFPFLGGRVGARIAMASDVVGRLDQDARTCAVEPDGVLEARGRLRARIQSGESTRPQRTIVGIDPDPVRPSVHGLGLTLLPLLGLALLPFLALVTYLPLLPCRLDIEPQIQVGLVARGVKGAYVVPRRLDD